MSELVKILPGENKYLSVTWQVNNFCNFRCSYCNEGNWSGTHKNDDIDTYIQFLDKLITRFQFKGYESFKFFFSGGEPVYWKPLLEVADFIHEKCDKPLLAINTNLSNSLKWWEKNYHLFQDVVASYHIESVNNENFLENAKFLQDKMNYLAIRMMMHDHDFDKVIKAGDKIWEEMDNCVLEWVPLLDELGTGAEPWYYREQWKRDFFKKTDGYKRKWGTVNEHREFRPAYSLEVWDDGKIQAVNSNRLAAERLNNFEGWHCWLSDAIFINAYGDISAGSCGVSGKIGNINEDWIEFYDQPIICPKSHCTCGTDIIIPKISYKVYDDETDYDIMNKDDINAE